MRRATLLLGLLLGGVALADSSPRVRMVARGQLAASAIADPGSPSQALVTVRVAGGAARLRALGLDARALSPGVAAVALSADALRYLETTLAGEPLQIEERRLMATLLDRAAAEVGAPPARQEHQLSGRGVLIGVVDTGVDVRHGDLRHADGTTRLGALLDVSIPADERHADLGDYGGAIWLRDELDAVLAAERDGLPPPVPFASRDDQGHGTHVASIAMGNGLGTGQGLPAGRYVGLAPEAELLAVRAALASGALTDVTVLSGCRFLVDRASALGRPLVVNLSLGATSGPHDGTSNLEVAFDELLGVDRPGRVLVVAAGNEGGRDLHAGGWALDGEVELPLELREGGAGSLAIEVWSRGAVALAMETPSGRRTRWVEPGGFTDESFDGEGRVILDDTSVRAGAGSSGAGVVLTELAEQRPVAGRWRLILRGRVPRYDAWLVDAPLRPLARFVERVVTDQRLVVPATARAAIAVGSTVSRLSWPTADGREYIPAGSDPARTGGPSFFSSTGPTADGRFAPDVAAPGEWVIAAMGADATPEHPGSVFRADPADPLALVADDGVHGVLRGTSQAAPVVTGAIALLLEAEPTLTGDAVRELLRATAAPVPGTAGWSPRAGFGRLDVAAALAYLRGARGAGVSPAQSRVGVSRDLLPPGSDETTVVTVTPRDDLGRPLGPGHAVEIELGAGEPAGPVVAIGARYERRFVAHAPRGAVGEVRVRVDGVELDARPRVHFVPSRAEAGGDLRAGGGCAHARGAAPAWPELLIALLFAIRVACRRRARA